MTDHLNAIQKICTNLSTDSELVIGEIYGLRQWKVNQLFDGSVTLNGHRGGSWNVRGKNTADCHLTERSSYHSLNLAAGMPTDYIYDELIKYLLPEIRKNPYAEIRVAVHITSLRDQKNFATWRSLYPKDLLDGHRPWSIQSSSGAYIVDGVKSRSNSRISFEIEIIEQVPAHDVADPSCTCGFYAYTDPTSLSDNSSTYGELVFGIIKAYGHVTEGTKGFRAQYAEIVGLTPTLQWKYPLSGNWGMSLKDKWKVIDGLADDLQPKTRYRTIPELLENYHQLTGVVS